MFQVLCFGVKDWEPVTTRRVGAEDTSKLPVFMTSRWQMAFEHETPPEVYFVVDASHDFPVHSSPISSAGLEHTVEVTSAFRADQIVHTSESRDCPRTDL